jgi:2Fe-2S ferredoxin
MPRITYRNLDGTSKDVDVAQGDSVMRGAVVNGVAGIVGECGGGAMCATCHVYVSPDNETPLAPMSEIEDELLYTTASPRRDTSRLSCQLLVTEQMEGFEVDLPAEQ